MTWRTHALTGINSLWILTAIPQTVTSDNIALLAILAVLGALTPDLDAHESKLKHLRVAGIKPLALVAITLHRTLGHRGFLHSLFGLCLVASLTVLLTAKLGWPAYAALMLGYASHLIADACTPSGLRFFYPNRDRYHLLPRRWRISTGSERETRLIPLLVVGAGVLLLSRLNAQLN